MKNKELEKYLLSMQWKYWRRIAGSKFYEKANNDYDKGTKVDLFKDRICFWDNSGIDHRVCIDLKDIIIPWGIIK